MKCDEGELLPSADRKMKILIVPQPKPWSCCVFTSPSFQTRWGVALEWPLNCGGVTMFTQGWQDQEVPPRKTYCSKSRQMPHCFGSSLCSQLIAWSGRQWQKTDMA